IRQHSRDTDPEKQSWDIYLDFEFGLLGMISTHLMLEENTLSASFWSVLPATQDKIDQNLPDFEQQINRAGFNLGQFNSFPGKPPVAPTQQILPSSESLLDIKV
ncbi:MAG: flagellar hook-length control protein FliK, partial [Gammaproteobacteria bacterium]|nr:flagellar hook-length control protein FliK [Gammaproteobacteria bacterium]